MSKSDDGNETPKNEDYEVGKNKPPQETQFKPGSEWQGNRHGRPKGSLNYDTLMRKAFTEKLPIADPETGRKLTGAEAAIIRLRNDSLKGKTHAVREFLAWLQAQHPQEDPASGLPESHRQIIEKALRRWAENEKKGKDV